MSQEQLPDGAYYLDVELDVISAVGGLLHDRRIASLPDEIEQGRHILDRFIGQSIARGYQFLTDGGQVSPADITERFQDNFGDRHSDRLLAVPGLQAATNLMSDDPRMWTVYEQTTDRHHEEDGQSYMANLAQLAGYLSIFQLPSDYRSRYPWRQVLLDDIVDQLIDDDYTMTPERSNRVHRAEQLARIARVDLDLVFDSCNLIFHLHDDGYDVDFATKLLVASPVPARPRTPLY